MSEHIQSIIQKRLKGFVSRFTYGTMDYRCYRKGDFIIVKIIPRLAFYGSRGSFSYDDGGFKTKIDLNEDIEWEQIRCKLIDLELEASESYEEYMGIQLEMFRSDLAKMTREYEEQKNRIVSFLDFRSKK